MKVVKARKKKQGLIASGQIELRTEFVDNPDWRPDLEGEKAFPRKVKVSVNIKESAVGTLAARNLISKAQAEAAVCFRRYWEKTGGAGARAIDYSLDKVDGGRIVESLDIKQMRAARKLADAERTLGKRNYDLVRSVCGEGKAMTEIFQTKRERLTAIDNLRASLDDLCRIWDLAITASSKPNMAHHARLKDDDRRYIPRTTKHA